MSQQLFTALMFTTGVAFAIPSTRGVGLIGLALIVWLKSELIPYLALVGIVIGGVATYISLNRPRRRRR